MEIIAGTWGLARAAHCGANRCCHGGARRGARELWTFLLSFAALTAFHELLHIAAHPAAGRSSQSIVGFWPSRVLFYAHYDGELTRNRFVAILLSSGWIAFISTFNAFLACVDVLGAGMVLFQIPATAVVRNQGWRTYWRRQPGRTRNFPAARG
jgi:hypothetical protein